MRKIIGYIFILSAGICLVLAIGKDKNLMHHMAGNIFFSRPHPLTLQEKIVADLELLKKQNIPTSLLSLNQVFWQDHRVNKKTKDISSLFSTHFPISKDGKYLLQIDCFDSDSTQLIIQMSFFEQKTKNKVFEISRDYPVGKN
jgi:hypothetical protein